MRYAVLKGDAVDNVIECEPEAIAAYCEKLGFDRYLAIDAAGAKVRAIDPETKITAALSLATKGGGRELDPVRVEADATITKGAKA